MSAIQTISASEFKAKCLDILDRLSTRKLTRVTITKRGKIVAILTPPEAEASIFDRVHGCMRDSTILPPDFDLTAPVLDEPFAAESGELHG
jgi:antitoxin (DNA-binding transcriptional repressor) of toxin-antitoxin stability system